MRFTRLLLTLLTLATPALAQSTSKSATAAIGLTLVSTLNLSKTTDMSLGSHFLTDPAATTGGAGGVAAVWSGNTDVGTALSASFSIPATLTSGANSVSFACGTTAAKEDGGVVTTFNPNSATNLPAVTRSGGTFTVTLGQSTVATADPTNCAATWSSSAKVGAYTGQIVLTISTL